MSDRPVVLFDPAPRPRAQIFADAQWERLQSMARVVGDGGKLTPEVIERWLPEAVAVIGHSDLPTTRLARAPLRAGHL